MSSKKTYEKIIDNRFKISGILIVLIGIIGFFISKVSIKNWILTTNAPLCFWWNIKFFALLLLSYELFLIISNNKKKLALGASVIIGFSSVVQFNLNNIDSLIIGELLSLLVYSFFKKDKKIVTSILFIIFSAIYTFTFRPYAVAFGYVFLGLIIWIIIKNIYEIKNNRKEIILGIATLLISITSMIICAIFLNNNNIEYLNYDQNGLSILFSYLYNPFLPYYNIEGKEIFSNFISAFPVPMIISLYYMYTREKHSEFLLPVTIVAVIETVFCISGVPEIISKITLFSQTSALRAMSAVSLANLFLVFYFLGNVDEELFKVKYAMRITIVLDILLAVIKYPVIFSSRKYILLFVIEFTIITYLLLNLEDKKYQKVLLFFLILFTLIAGVPVNLQKLF